MQFAGFYEKKARLVCSVGCLEDLIRWRLRVNIGNTGLGYKTSRGALIRHSYTGRNKRDSGSNGKRIN